MKIYIAAFYQSRLAGADTTSSTHTMVAKLARHYPYMLESYHYMKPRILDAIRDNKGTIFLDSGAFSMFTQGITVDLRSYAEFIRSNKDIIHVASNLDAIGAGQEKLSYDRQKELEGMDVDVKPVHHVRDHDKWLQQYLDEGYDYIFLGGMVPENTPTLRDWLDHIWHHYLTNDDGTPKVKVHGFGLTTLDLMFRYPWYSIDSTSWVMIAQFGSVLLDMPQVDGSIKVIKVDFSTKSTKRYDINSWHFNRLTRPEQDSVIRRLEELEAARLKEPEEEARLEELTGYKQGFNQKALAESYAWRDYMNIEYFRRAMERKVDRFIRKQGTLLDDV